MPERFCTMYEKCKFRSMGYISAFDKSQCVNMIQRMFVCDLKLQQKTPIIYLIQSGMKAQLVSYLLCVQICVIWTETSWQLTI